jgi:hypothetical protein
MYPFQCGGNMHKFRSAALGAGAITLLASAGLAAAIPASATARSSASWGITYKTASSANFPYFSAGSASSATSAWAFLAEDANVKPAAYQLSGGRWHPEPFPGAKANFVVSASDLSGSDAWAFTQGTNPRALHYNGHKWSALKSFSKPISSALGLSAKDAWVFGLAYAPKLGNVHYNGHTWASTGGPALQGASALSASSIWAYGLNEVAHWNGKSWKATSVKNLLPKSTDVCAAGSLDGIYAISAKSVYAIAGGGCPDYEGPFILLHYNGSKWSLVKTPTLYANPVSITGDGSGGVWIASLSGAPPTGYLDHYSNGKLTALKLPAKHMSFLGGVDLAPHSKTAFVFGSINNTQPPTKSAGAILRYGS